VGGENEDRLQGNADDDILIAGLLSFADSDEIVFEVMDIWTSDEEYLERIDRLSNPADRYALLPGVSAVDDDDRDTLTGSSGSDWFFYDLQQDRATDQHKEIGPSSQSGASAVQTPSADGAAAFTTMSGQPAEPSPTFSEAQLAAPEVQPAIDDTTVGVVILRHLFGFTGEALVDGTVDLAGNRTDANTIAETVALCRDALFDVDANGKVDALTDGVVILRYLSGFRDDPLVDGAVDPSGTRTDPYEVTAFLERLFPPKSAATPASPQADPSGTSSQETSARDYYFADLGSFDEKEEDEDTNDPLSADLPIILYYAPE